jgi:hypothetical protein
MDHNLPHRGGPDSLLMTASHYKIIVGKTLAMIARERNESPVEAAIQIVRKSSFNMK